MARFVAADEFIYDLHGEPDDELHRLALLEARTLRLELLVVALGMTTAPTHRPDLVEAVADVMRGVLVELAFLWTRELRP